ncbi:hypothetical protein BD309DRAFT_873495 [Dichomitus squalens]|uniref:Uncharacterized protein n=2 Tax=Dichomitus squalens TaxID=114155 RepID=A0A4Q9NH72_9APHY|nr:uncharacterized protein DICSQDRAFT_172233 [Dichomitus squalens LYAD-421 SS1]EJF59250.1 hypothetical protein DICSQDRAFT_172233 [Dichomitus squalens LYAD-421 SS1]TBU38851.1 hypothetical protein BD309DRAFT_873495 [Dichomitus squalens]TBU51468.1 hypothetical protein BD310DRAFT_834285 [Dichomitus squalens]
MTAGQRPEREQDMVACINLHTITREEAQRLESLEHALLGYVPPSGSLAAQAQAAVARRGAHPVTKGAVLTNLTLTLSAAADTNQ